MMNGMAVVVKGVKKGVERGNDGERERPGVVVTQPVKFLLGE